MASRTGDIWVALSGAGIARLNQQTGRFTSYDSSPTAAAGYLNDKDVRTLYEDAEGTVWAGTNQGGLHRFDTQTNTFTYFSTREGLPSNHVVSIMGDQRGNLWLGTNQGLSRFNVKAKTFRNYGVSDGLPTNEFNLGSVYRKKDKLLFGTVNGFVVFHPNSIRDNALAPPVYLTGLKVLEKSRLIPTSPLELQHQENFLSFDFVALNYMLPRKTSMPSNWWGWTTIGSTQVRVVLPAIPTFLRVNIPSVSRPATTTASGMRRALRSGLPSIPLVAHLVGLRFLWGMPAGGVICFRPLPAQTVAESGAGAHQRAGTGAGP